MYQYRMCVCMCVCMKMCIFGCTVVRKVEIRLERIGVDDSGGRLRLKVMTTDRTGMTVKVIGIGNTGRRSMSDDGRERGRR